MLMQTFAEAACGCSSLPPYVCVSNVVVQELPFEYPPQSDWPFWPAYQPAHQPPPGCWLVRTSTTTPPAPPFPPHCRA